jgi:hypothetical protein
MKRSMRSLLVITCSTALVALLSLSGCKKHQLPEGASSGSPSNGAQTVGQQDATGGTQNPVGHAGGWSAKDAQLAVGQPTVGSAPTHGSDQTSTGAATDASHPQDIQAATNTGNQASTTPEAPKEIPVTCFVETFKHKATPGHDSEEACSHHKNLVSLSHKVINPKSVCVRVNDVPVKFQTVANGELLIGSVAGPKAAITVSYCTGKNTCEFTKKNDCVVPKDEFMDAIGGGDTDDGAVAQWENTGNNEADAKLNNDVKRELADIDDAAPEQTGKASVFKDWTNEKTSPSCGQVTAQANIKK